jgi:hypothetical protein
MPTDVRSSLDVNRWQSFNYMASELVCAVHVSSYSFLTSFTVRKEL